MLNKNEKMDDLEINDLKIIQNKEWFCYGMDSVLLANYAKQMKNNSVILDIGTGTGIIPILLSAKTNAQKMYAIEIQKEVAEMAKRSVKLNKLENLIEVKNIDIRDIFEEIAPSSIDVITINPPYKKLDTGGRNENKHKLISRHEVEGTLEDFIKISSKLLKSNGELYMVHRPERLVDIITLSRLNKLEVKKIKFVYSRKEENSKLVLFKMVKCAKPYVEIEEPLIIYEKDGKYTEQLLKIYNK